MKAEDVAPVKARWSGAIRAMLHCSVVASLALSLNGRVLAQTATHAASAANPTLLIVGDSLSAEYGLARGSGWVALLTQRLQENKLSWQVVNASISGDTTSGGKGRLPPLLSKYQPRVVVLELGANDALRGQPVFLTRGNLLQMCQQAGESGARVMIAGIQVPPNYGPQYTRDFAAMFVEVAKTCHAALLPFLLSGVADAPDAENWFQADRIHPLAAAHPRILDNVWPVLKPLLTR
jgi:acyl-CoA thioesterase-1